MSKDKITDAIRLLRGMIDEMRARGVQESRDLRELVDAFEAGGTDPIKLAHAVRDFLKRRTQALETQNEVFDADLAEAELKLEQQREGN
jgi:hypothetical protein